MPFASSLASRALMAGAVSLALILPAAAHHGWAGNVEELSNMTGTVVQGVSLAGPHATMKIKVKNQVWDVTLAPPARTSRSGLKEGVIPVGAQLAYARIGARRVMSEPQHCASEVHAVVLPGPKQVVLGRPAFFVDDDAAADRAAQRLFSRLRWASSGAMTSGCPAR